MKIINTAEVEKYLYSILPKRDAVLSEMEGYAKRNDVPIVGPAVGRMLAQLVQLIDAKRIFELGSAIGYSTLWMARAAGSSGAIHYALTALDSTTGDFDIIFNDVDKVGYPDVFRKAVSRVRSGGLFITDNTLWSGRVTRAAKPNDRNTRAIQQFNKLCYASPDLFPVLIPLRDGVLVCRKR